LKKYGSISPGPGAYVPRSNNKEANLSYSMGQKLGSAILGKGAGGSPGPGGYDPVYHYKYDGHTKFGTG
jgi:hypothetical protein